MVYGWAFEWLSPQDVFDQARVVVWEPDQEKARAMAEAALRREKDAKTTTVGAAHPLTEPVYIDWGSEY